MDPVIRRRYEVVKTQDLVDYFSSLNITPTCTQCQGTKFHIPTIRTLTIGPVGDENQSDGSIEKVSLEPFEMQGGYSNGPAYYALTCEFCGSILNVDALRILLWTERKRDHEAMKAKLFGQKDVGERHE